MEMSVDCCPMTVELGRIGQRHRNLFFRQGETHVLRWACRRQWIPLGGSWLEHAPASNRNCDVLTAVYLIHGRDAFLGAGQIVFPENLAVILIVGAEFSIGR